LLGGKWIIDELGPKVGQSINLRNWGNETMDKYKEDKIWLNSPMKLDIGKLGEWDNR
jgi:hypothetical protein